MHLRPGSAPRPGPAPALSPAPGSSPGPGPAASWGGNARGRSALAPLLAAALLLLRPAPASAQEACATSFSPPPDVISVAWVSPTGKRVGGGASIDVVPTAALRSWVATEKPGVGRMLQRLGLQKKADEPKKTYKIVIFEVRSGDLCRPISDPEGGVVAGVASCEKRKAQGDGGRTAGGEKTPSGCGYTADRADGARGLDLYTVQWRDAVARGFCVLPADRFVIESTGR